MHAVQAAVVGLSCRHDVMELLEKRVRSRFSHRKQLIPEMEEKHFDHPGDSPKDVLAAMLTMPDPDCSAAQTSGPVQQWNCAVSHVLSADAVVQQLKLMMNQGKRSCLKLQVDLIADVQQLKLMMNKVEGLACSQNRVDCQ